MMKISSKLIKPENPTPESLKNYYISFIDQCVGAMNLGVVLLYRGQSKEKQQRLEESLAKVLVQFYPLAGRYLKNDHCVDCSDQGVEWVEAEAEAEATVELEAADDQLQLLFLPDHYFRVGEAAHHPLLSIQATHFPCGGLALGISVSHRVFDACSLGTFIAAWSAANYYYTGTATATAGAGAASTWNILPSLLPHNPDHRGFHIHHSEAAQKIATKRLVFKEAKNQASRVRGVIAQALIRVDAGRSRDFIIFEPVNMRGKTAASASFSNACGNFSVASVTPRLPASIGIEELVRVIDDASARAVADHAQILSPEGDGRQLVINSLGNLGNEMMNPETKAIVFSDWSKCGFNEADFGWGKPVLTSVAPHRPFNNSTVLLSTKDGDGIEAWVNLNCDNMRCFLQDHQIKLIFSST